MPVVCHTQIGLIANKWLKNFPISIRLDLPPNIRIKNIVVPFFISSMINKAISPLVVLALCTGNLVIF